MSKRKRIAIKKELYQKWIPKVQLEKYDNVFEFIGYIDEDSDLDDIYIKRLENQRKNVSEITKKILPIWLKEVNSEKYDYIFE